MSRWMTDEHGAVVDLLRRRPQVSRMSLIEDAQLDVDEQGIVLILSGDFLEAALAYVADIDSPGLRLRIGQETLWKLVRQSHEVA